MGDCLDPGAITPAVAGCDAVIHLVGISREFPGRGVTFERVHVQATKNLVDRPRRRGSALSAHERPGGQARPRRPLSCHQFPGRRVRPGLGAHLHHLRPSLIYGPRDRSINLFVRQIQRLGFLTIIGDGQYQLQPVPVDTVARAFALALELPAPKTASTMSGGRSP